MAATKPPSTRASFASAYIGERCFTSTEQQRGWVIGVVLLSVAFLLLSVSTSPNDGSNLLYNAGSLVRSKNTTTIRTKNNFEANHPPPKMTMGRSGSLLHRIRDGGLLRQPDIYSVTRPDRSGSQVQDMMMAHAWAFHRGARYMGSCRENGNDRFRPQTEHLIEQLGLQNLLVFACPTKQQMGRRFWQFWRPPKPKVVSGKRYREFDTAVFTPDWWRQFRELVRSSQRSKDNDDNNNQNNDNRSSLSVVIHIRRGDVRCGRHEMRYLPNSHYRRVLRRYVFGVDNNKNEVAHGYRDTQHINITIHSESGSMEPWNHTTAYWVGDLAGGTKRDVAVQLKLDGPLDEAWRDMMSADVLILSKSSFSFAPAILNFDEKHHTILYTPFWHDPLPLPNWVTVDSDLVEQADADVKRLCQS